MGGQFGPAANLVKRSAVAAPPVPDLAQRTPCLLINPRSFNAARAALATRAARLAHAHGARVLEAADAVQIDAAIDLLSATPLRPIFVLAGDGTVQALVDRLAALEDEVARPQLFVLGGGRSNLTAGDHGGSGALLVKLESALRRWRDGPALVRESRQVLRIEQPPLPPRHGFFLAAGLLDYIIRACHRQQAENQGRLRAGNAGTAFTVLGLALAAMVGRREAPLDVMRLTIPGRNLPADCVRLLVATTLERCPGLPASATRGPGGVRFAAVAARGITLWTELALLAMGRPRSGDAGDKLCHGRCDALHLHGLSSYTLDGEEFQADPARPVLVRSGPPITFLTL